ncbi:MAG: hypothetical protein RL313_655 [Actinomycetota bacterium]
MFKTSTDSGDRADQQRIITARVVESGKNTSPMFSLVTSEPTIGPSCGSGFGFPSELKSTALAKLGGRLTDPSCHLCQSRDGMAEHL